MSRLTISEKILSAKSADQREARAGDTVVCTADLVLGTDGSAPMAIDYFEQMGGTSLAHPERVVFSLDHYAPPSTAATARFHDRIRAFSVRTGARVIEVGQGISHQIVVERALVRPGQLVVGADSHTVTAAALDLFAAGIGSSDLAAAMLTGKVWLRVPETILVVLSGQLRAPALAKDAALALVGMLGGEGANYRALEFAGAGVDTLTVDDRLVFSNMLVECGAKTAIFPCDGRTAEYLARRGVTDVTPVTADAGARYLRRMELDLSAIVPMIALPHQPDNVVPLAQAVGTPVHMVFLGTCTGGRVSDYHEALAVIERCGGAIARGVQLVVTPASRDIYLQLMLDGSLSKFAELGAIITTPGCGACCGTSGVIPGDGMTVVSTANRNFKARMGNATASIYLASPAACAAAAASGRIANPEDWSAP